MDVDAFVAAHRREWDRLEHLLRRAGRPRRLTGAEVDELVALYQRVATQLSLLQSRSPDPVLVGRLSSLVARARAAVTGGRSPAWRDVARFLAVSFPAAVWRSRWWWIGASAAFVVVSFALGAWIAGSPEAQAAVGTPEEIRQLVEEDFEDYYSTDPASSFAARVWTNNVWAAAQALLLGVLFCLPTVFVLLLNAVNVAVAGGLMAANGRTGLFFGLILPHGLLELTAVFVAAGVGLRLGWTLIDPGPRRRVDALAEEGRAAVTVALGLVLVLGISGVIEAFVTPSPLPTWARLVIGVVALVGFLAYIGVLGRRAVRAGETGDLTREERGDTLPVAG